MARCISEDRPPSSDHESTVNGKWMEAPRVPSPSLIPPALVVKEGTMPPLLLFQIHCRKVGVLLTAEANFKQAHRSSLLDEIKIMNK